MDYNKYCNGEADDLSENSPGNLDEKSYSHGGGGGLVCPEGPAGKTVKKQ